MGRDFSRGVAVRVTLPGAEPSRAQQAIGYVTPANADGWFVRQVNPIGRFDDIFDDTQHRVEPDGKVRFRIVPKRHHQNLNDVAHGSFLLAMLDHAIFGGPVALGVERVIGGSTVELSTQFYEPVVADTPIDIVVEVMRQTGRMVFVRCVIEQDGQVTNGCTGIVRRVSEAASQEGVDRFIFIREKALRQSHSDDR